MIAIAGPGPALVAVARRARCTACGRKGCHVEPERPPAFGTPGYHEWMREEMIRSQAWLIWAHEQF